MMVVILLALLTLSTSTSVESNDLLNGYGLFSSASIGNFTIDGSHSATFLTWNGEDVMKLQKPSGQAISYTQGVGYAFTASKPTHIQFKFASSDPDTEDSNLRIMDSNDQTLILFRAGKGGLIRVNQQQMISFYNQSVSTDSTISLTQIDMTINWDDKQITVFVNSKFKAYTDFFNSNITSVSKVLLYNLYNSVSYWQDLVICSSICYSFSSEVLLYGFSAFASILLLLLF